MHSLTEHTKIFIDSFHKAIAMEMEAMRKRLGSFEVPLSNGEVMLENLKENFYTFKIASSNDKLVLNTECTLRYDGGEALVTIAKIEKEIVTLSCQHKIGLGCGSYILVIYPWFLYEKLKAALTGLLKSNDVHLDSALRTFGKIAFIRKETPLQLSHLHLNKSQQMAVALSCDSNLAFVWGPPGTGKTTTLGHIVSELLNKEYRILITSTTNAAVDQALAKLKTLQMAQGFFERGYVVRGVNTIECRYSESIAAVERPPS